MCAKPSRRPRYAKRHDHEGQASARRQLLRSVVAVGGQERVLDPIELEPVAEVVARAYSLATSCSFIIRATASSVVQTALAMKR